MRNLTENEKRGLIASGRASAELMIEEMKKKIEEFSFLYPSGELKEIELAKCQIVISLCLDLLVESRIKSDLWGELLRSMGNHCDIMNQEAHLSRRNRMD